MDFWESDGQDGYVPSVPGVHDTLASNGDDTWTLTRTSLEVYEFDAEGRLTSVTDKNSNTTTLTYTNPTYPNLVTGISDPGRPNTCTDLRR